MLKSWQYQNQDKLVQIRAPSLTADLPFTKCVLPWRHWGTSTQPLFLGPLLKMYKLRLSLLKWLGQGRVLSKKWPNWDSNSVCLQSPVSFCLIIPQFYVRVVRQCQRSTMPSLWDRPGTCCFDFLSASLSFYSFEAHVSTAFLQMIWLKPSSLQSQLNHSFLYVVPAHLAGFWESRFLVHLSYVLWILTSI